MGTWCVNTCSRHILEWTVLEKRRVARKYLNRKIPPKDGTNVNHPEKLSTSSVYGFYCRWSARPNITNQTKQSCCGFGATADFGSPLTKPWIVNVKLVGWIWQETRYL